MITAAEFLEWCAIFNVQFGGGAITIPVPISQGGTGVTSVTVTPTASMWAGWDANKNLSANNFLDGYTSTATAAATTTLTVGSTGQQFFTGSTTQTVLLPVTSTLTLGHSFYIVNNSSGTVTVQSSGANTIQAMAANTTLLVTCILTSGTTASSWNAQYNVANPGGTYLPLAGGTMSGAINMGAFNITNLATPLNQMDAATKAYVDLVAQGLNILPAAQAASTAPLTASYSNGASGIGATLTNSGAQAAFVIDGYTASINDEILIKDQASSLQNGVYNLTTVGSGSTNWVLTRSTFYDTPQQINPGDLIIINNGTSNGRTSWIQTAVVTAVGVDPISFTQFGAVFPLTVPNGGIGIGSATPYGVIVGGTTSTSHFQSVIPGSTGTIFQSNGSLSLPTWSTATYPSSTTINQLLYSSSSNIISGLSTLNSSVLITDSGGVPGFSTTLPSGLTIPGYLSSSLTNDFIFVGNGSNIAIGVSVSGDLTLVNTGAFTVISIGGKSISLADSFTTSGNFPVIQTYTGSTNVTFPTSGTLATTSQLPTPAALTKTDDTNVTLTLGGTPASALLQAVSLTLGWTGQLGVGRGGSGAGTLTGLLTGNGTSAFTATAITQYNVLTGGASNAPNSVVPSATSGIPLISQGSSSQPIFGTALVAGGGTGSTSFNTNGVVISNTTSTGALTSLALTDGQIIIGSSIGAPAAASLIAGTNITITPGHNTITIAASAGGTTNVNQNSSSATLAANSRYATNNGASLVTYTIPAGAAIGDTYIVVGGSSGGWTIAQPGSVVCHYGTSTTTTGVGGSLSSTNQYDCCTITCIASNTFSVYGVQGNITVV